MSFPPGRPVLVMVVVALLSGGAHVLMRAEPARRADLVVWTFSPQHADVFTAPLPPDDSSLIERFERRTGQSVHVEMLSRRALDLRLASLFMSGDAGAEAMPDLVELEIGSVGTLFRPPVKQIGLLPLNEFLRASSVGQDLLASRLTPYAKEGSIFGIPHDVHPVTITYRRDLWDQAGLDPTSATTWRAFHEMCLAYDRYWRAHDEPGRRALELPTRSADMLALMLLQRGVNLVDGAGRVHLTDPRTVETVAFYATLVAGDHRVSLDPAPTPSLAARELAIGRVGAVITPDWRIAQLKSAAPELDGRLAMMPLPRIDAGGARTSTWGGTMIGIPRGARDPRRSWDLLQALYLSDDAHRARQLVTDILPPMPSHWTDPAYQRPDTFFAGQRIGALYAELADEIPPRHVTPYSGLASAHLSVVLSRARREIEARGDDDDLDEACAMWLAEAQGELERLIAFGERR